MFGKGTVWVFWGKCDCTENWENKAPDYVQGCLVNLFKGISNAFKIWSMIFLLQIPIFSLYINKENTLSSDVVSYFCRV